MTYSLLTKLNFATRHHCSVRIFATRDADWLAKFRKFNGKYFGDRAARTVFRGSRNHIVTLRKKWPSKLITQLAYSINLSRRNRLSMTKESVWGAVTERIDCRRL